MSRRDIETVCTLAAHLALHSTYAKLGDVATLGPRAAQDAMTLQRLSARARRCAGRLACGVYTQQQWEDEMQRLDRAVDEVLRPYGLDGRARDHGLRIVGLPSNGDGEGYAI
jgi:hypothetical protein